MFSALATRALSLLDPETSHEWALRALAAGWPPIGPPPSPPALATTLAGLELANPVGLAAGFDKDGRAPGALLRCGFGFVECGTVTPRPQAGSPRPRVFRLRRERSVINRLGFNNGGLDALLARLPEDPLGVIGVNIGANRDSPDRLADYAAAYRAAYPRSAYVTVNISSPNTPGLRDLQQGGALEDLLGRLSEVRRELAVHLGRRPLFLKLAPDLSPLEARRIAETAAAWSVEGLVVSNTTVTRPATLRSRAAREAGGLSGRALFEPSTRALRTFAEAGLGRLALIGVGGVENGATAYAKIKAGAGALQLYTALVYRGPGVVRAIQRELCLRLRADGFAAVGEAVGADLS